MKEAFSSWPSRVVLHPLVERAADALGHSAVDLALDDHRVDQRAAVVDDAVAQDLDLGRLRVGLDDDGVHAVGERRPGRRVVVGALQPGRLPRGHRRLVGVGGGGELGGPPGRLVEGVAERVGEDGDGAEVDRTRPTRGRPSTRTCPSTISRSSTAASSACGGDPQRLLPDLAGGQGDRAAAHHRGARGERADGVLEAAGVAGRDGDPARTARRARRRRSARASSGGPGPGWSGRWRRRRCRRSRPGCARPRRGRRRCPRRSRPARCRPCAPRRAPRPGTASKSSQPTSCFSVASEAGKSPES